jgi:hypothetical protein
VAFDEELADRVRDVLGGQAGLSEKRMFGGLGFLVNGNMACAVMSKGGLMVRVGPEAHPAAVLQDGVSAFEMGGRTMAGWVVVHPRVLTGADALLDWVDQGLAFARALPAGGTAAKKPMKRAPKGTS